MLKECLHCKKEFEGNRKSLFCPSCNESKQKPLPKEETPEKEPNKDEVKEIVVPKPKVLKTPKNDVKLVNPDAPMNRLMREPEKGTNAYFLRYGRFD
jgi:hypothetical protein